MVEEILDLSKADWKTIKDYKNTWLRHAHRVSVDSSMDVPGKVWCKSHLERWNWSFKPFTSEDKHTFYFEREENAKRFSSEVK